MAPHADLSPHVHLAAHVVYKSTRAGRSTHTSFDERRGRAEGGGQPARSLPIYLAVCQRGNPAHGFARTCAPDPAACVRLLRSLSLLCTSHSKHVSNGASGFSSSCCFKAHVAYVAAVAVCFMAQTSKEDWSRNCATPARLSLSGGQLRMLMRRGNVSIVAMTHTGLVPQHPKRDTKATHHSRQARSTGERVWLERVWFVPLPCALDGCMLSDLGTSRLGPAQPCSRHVTTCARSAAYKTKQDGGGGQTARASCRRMLSAWQLAAAHRGRAQGDWRGVLA